LKKVYFTLHLGIIGDEDSGKEVFITYLNKNSINPPIPEKNENYLIHDRVPLKIKVYLARNFKELIEENKSIKRLDIILVTLNLYNIHSFVNFNFEDFNNFCIKYDFRGISILCLMDTHLTKNYNRSNILRIDRYSVIEKLIEYNIIYCFEIQNDTTDIMELFDKVFNEFIFKLQLSNPELFERLINYGKTLFNQYKDKMQERKKEKIQQKAGGLFNRKLIQQKLSKEGLSSDYDPKTRLYGMINAEKKINLESAKRMIGLSEDEIKGLIYDLVGEGKIDGNFEGNEFIIKSDIEDFIRFLDASFVKWGQEVKAKAKKNNQNKY
jgi:hypothetical protein